MSGWRTPAKLTHVRMRVVEFRPVAEGEEMDEDLAAEQAKVSRLRREVKELERQNKGEAKRKKKSKEKKVSSSSSEPETIPPPRRRTHNPETSARPKSGDPVSKSALRPPRRALHDHVQQQHSNPLL